ncbi:MAG TPA: hypothetical protein VEC11_12615 [Allosphingosinicella sp.]|nr:hypothetical protein [Allosphingosinicella sp.]
MTRRMILLAGLTAGLAGAARGQQPPPPVNVDTNQAVNACLTPAQQRQPLAQIGPAQRRRLVACIFENTARQINAQLPVQVDELTRLDRITVAGPSLTYHYSTTGLRAELPPNVAALLEQHTRAFVCGQANMAQTLQLGGTYGYRWSDRTGVLIHQVQITRC